MRRLVALLIACIAVAAVATTASAARPDYILALSWEPSFCSGHAAKPECRSETSGRADAARLSLHGLWPEPSSRAYCNVDPSLVAADKRSDWNALPAVALSADVRSRLAVAMPGTQSLLERHEWLKHGTCYGGDADAYFSEELALVDAVNASAVGALFAAGVGKQLTADDVRAAFDKGFGAGAGMRVKLACENGSGGRLLSEITIGLVGRPGGGKSLADLIIASSPTSPGCPGGLVASAP